MERIMDVKNIPIVEIVPYVRNAKPVSKTGHAEIHPAPAKKGKIKKSKANALHIIGGFFNSKGGRVCHAKKKITSSTLHRIKAMMKP